VELTGGRCAARSYAFIPLEKGFAGICRAVSPGMTLEHDSVFRGDAQRDIEIDDEVEDLLKTI